MGKFRKFAILVIAIVTAGLYVRSRESDKKTQTAKATRGEIVESVSTSGKVAASQIANLTFQTGGKIAWVAVKEGDSVKRGQGIAGLDTVILNATYQQSLNNYRNLQAALENVLDQVKNHAGDETFAQKATRTSAEVARDNAYDATVAAKHALYLATITSPFIGIVVEANPPFPGINVTPGTASYIIVNPASLYFEAEVEESDLPRIKIGQDVEINLDAYKDKKFTGKITFIGLVGITSETGGNAYKVKISLSRGKEDGFSVGMRGDSDIIIGRKQDVLKIPQAAVILDGNKTYVERIIDTKKEKVEVALGAESDDEVEIISGLNENDTINLPL